MSQASTNQTIDSKEWVKIGIDLQGASEDYAFDYFKEAYGDIKGSGYFSTFTQVKGTIATLGLEWDSSKSTGENIAYISGTLAQDAILAPYGLVVGALGGTALKAAGIDLGQVAQDAYNYQEKLSEMNQLETDNFNNLPPDAQARMTEQGIFPGGPGWNSHIVDMQKYLEYGDISSDVQNKLDQQEDAQEEKSFWGDVIESVESAYDGVTSWVSGAWGSVANAISPESRAANAQGEQEKEDGSRNQKAEEAEEEGSTTTEADVTKANEYSRSGGNSDYDGGGSNSGGSGGGGTRSPGGNSPGTSEGEGRSGGSDHSASGGNDGSSHHTPIVLDLDGDGIELISIDNSNAFYDFSDDGYRENVGWVSKDDALLALDINNDGLIEGSKELAFASYGQIAIDEQNVSRHDFNNDGIVSIHDFDLDGNGMISDLEGLRYFDDNKDGVIDNRDSIFDSLRVWQDLDSDGVSDTGELDSLASVKGLDGFGISSISLDSNQVTQHLDGNISYGTGAYTTTNNEVKDLGDIAFRASDIGYKENEEDGSISLKSGQQGKEVETRFLGDGDDNFILSATNPNTIAAYGEAGNDIISNNNFNDVLIDGGAGDDTLSGGSGNDWISGGAGADTLSGGAGHDVLFIDNEDVSIDGGAGNDVGIATSSIHINLDTSNLEALLGSSENDTIYSSGNTGVTIDGRDGDDIITGGSGDDILAGGAGSDTLYGGAGDDTLIVDSSDTFDGGAGRDTLIFSDDVAHNINISDFNIEAVRGGSGDDIFRTNNDQAAILDGGGGNDKLYGSFGKDVLSGGAGNDELRGGYGDDTYVFVRGSGKEIIDDSFERNWTYYSKSGYLSQDSNGVWLNHNGDEQTPQGTNGETKVEWKYYKGQGWIGQNELGEYVDSNGEKHTTPTGEVGEKEVTWTHYSKAGWVGEDDLGNVFDKAGESIINTNDLGELPQSERSEALQSQLLGFGVASEDTNILRSNVSSGVRYLLLNGTLTTSNSFISTIATCSEALSAQLLGFGVASEDTNILRSNVSRSSLRGVRCLLLNGTLILLNIKKVA